MRICTPSATSIRQTRVGSIIDSSARPVPTPARVHAHVEGLMQELTHARLMFEHLEPSHHADDFYASASYPAWVTGPAGRVFTITHEIVNIEFPSADSLVITEFHADKVLTVLEALELLS